MKLTVLVDNNTLIDQYYLGEPGVSYYIEDEDSTLLFDTGYSDIFIKNAALLDIDLAKVQNIVISHGHDDHTRGLHYLHSQNALTDATIVAHPQTFMPKFSDDLFVGCPLTESQLREKYALNLSKEPVKVSKNCTFLGEIPQYTSFESRKSRGYFENGLTRCDDILLDDSALVYSGAEGLFIITGCSHSGIGNIIAHAQSVCNDNRIVGVIGGFHLLEVSEQLIQTIQYFKNLGISRLYPCHCVSFAAKAEIHKHIPIQEVGVGMSITV